VFELLRLGGFFGHDWIPPGRWRGRMPPFVRSMSQSSNATVIWRSPERGFICRTPQKGDIGTAWT
jgi:hypothetical protein